MKSSLLFGHERTNPVIATRVCAMFQSTSRKKAKRGISTVLGVLLMVGILFTTIIPLFMYVNSVNNHYDTTVVNMGLADQERSMEDLTVYTYWENDSSAVRLQLINDGSISINVIRIWVMSEDLERYHLFTSENVSTALNGHDLPLHLNPSNQATIENLTLTIIDPLNPEKNVFYVEVTSDRGNVFASNTNPLRHTPEILLTFGTLNFIFEKESLKFTSPGFPVPQPAWIVPGSSDEPLMFLVEIINVGKYDVILKAETLFWLIEYSTDFHGSSPKGYSFFIVDPDSLYPDQMWAYNEAVNPYVIEANPEGKWLEGGPPIIIKFGSYKIYEALGKGLVEDKQYLVTMGMYYHYDVDGERYDFGQNIPFVAVQSVWPYPPS